jgi:surface antigen
MKKIWILVGLVLFIILGTIFFNNRSDDSLFQEIRLLFTPDPMAQNTYDNGECTYYVFDRVKDDGKKIERGWHDAENWAERAKEDEYTVNKTPKEGAVLQTEDGELGHVAYIENIKDNGALEISEMNLEESYEVTERIIDPEDIDKYLFIHPQENPHKEKYINSE